LLEISNVSSVLPLAHALVVFATTTPAAHAIRVPDKQVADFVRNAKVNGRARSFVAHIAHTALDAIGLRCARPAKLLPAARTVH